MEAGARAADQYGFYISANEYGLAYYLTLTMTNRNGDSDVAPSGTGESGDGDAEMLGECLDPRIAVRPRRLGAFQAIEDRIDPFQSEPAAAFVRDDDGGSAPE